MEGRSGSRGRIASLDGLRGLAAATVLFTHVLLAGIAFHAYDARDAPVWAGNVAVGVFFVLSEFVLTLPSARRAENWVAYYPARLLRLYLPIWGAIALAAVLHKTTGWHTIAGGSWWLNAHAVPMTARHAAATASLVKSISWGYGSALWSLKWEVIFSVLLPLYILVGRVARPASLIAAAVALALIASGRSSYTNYLPVFFLGTLLALNVDRIKAAWRWLPTAGQTAVVVATVSLSVEGLWGPAESGNGGLGSMLQACGCALIVTLAVASERFDWLLIRRPVHWLGTRSFSLYRVHESIVVSTAVVLDRPNDVGLVVLIALPIVLVVTELFFRFVERPAHRVSRIVRCFVRQRTGPLSGRPAV